MNRVFVCSQYGFKTNGTTPIAENGADLTLAANTLNDKNLIFTNRDCNLSFDGTYDPKEGFGISYRYNGLNESIVEIKNATYVKRPIIAAVAKIATYTFAAPIETLAYGDTISLELHILSADPWDKDRRISFPYVLTTADDLTTYANANHWIKRMMAAFVAAHPGIVTITTSSAYVFVATSAVAGQDFTFSSGGVLPKITEVIGTANVYPQGTSAQIQKLYDEYNSVRGDNVTHTKQDSSLYSVPSPVVSGTNYLEYVITFRKLTETHPLGAKTHSVERTIHICIPENGAANPDLVRDSVLEDDLDLLTA